MKFTLQHKDPASKARAGELATDHGVIRTPIFMPVGTAATVKGIFHRDVRDEARAQIILANTYHLYMRPGMEIIEKAGGVHRCSCSRGYGRKRKYSSTAARRTWRAWPLRGRCLPSRSMSEKYRKIAYRRNMRKGTKQFRIQNSQIRLFYVFLPNI